MDRRHPKSKGKSLDGGDARRDKIQTKYTDNIAQMNQHNRPQHRTKSQAALYNKVAFNYRVNRKMKIIYYLAPK